MSNQETKFIKIESSFSYIGGDKSQQGLQEYINSPLFNKNSPLEVDNTSTELKVVDMLGEATNTTTN